MPVEASPLQIPGYDVHVNWTPAPCCRSEMEARMRSGETREDMFHGPRLFTNGWHLCAHIRDDDIRMPLITLTEKEMVEFMNQVTDDPGWEMTMTEATAERWHKKQKGELGWWDWSFSTETMEYLIQELRYKAKVFKETGLISLYHGDVVKSDTTIPKELRERLKAAAAALGEEVLVKQKKERKGVVDIVDPNLSTVSFGHTRVIVGGVLDRETCLQQMKAGSRLSDKTDFETLVGSYWRPYLVAGPPDPIPPRARRVEEYRTYSRAQWLPCDIDISGDVPRITTYINNLHPREYAPLYGIIEEVLAKVIPAWNMTLTPLRNLRFKRRINFRAPDYGDIGKWMEENGPKMEEFQGEKYPKYAFRAAQTKLYGSKAQEFLRKPQVSEEFKEPDPSIPVVDLKENYKDRGLQIIVCMRDIYLTPEQPMLSDAPEFQIEGIPVRRLSQFFENVPQVLRDAIQNDHICAVAKYYYDIENVGTGKRLVFAHPEKVSPEFDANELWSSLNYDWLQTIFGLKHEKASCKEAGTLNIPEGRLVTFPNLLFYTHNRFKLVDQTKNGHCKILTLLLVDPNIRVISSAIVPCQQYDWWIKEVTAEEGPLRALPYDLRLEVVKYISRWYVEGTGYDKAYQEQQLIFKTRSVHTRHRNFPTTFEDISSEEEDKD